MIEEGADIPAGQVLTCDVCVIGGGAAGITLALELAARNVQVVLVEAGGLSAGRAGDVDLDGEVLDNRTHAALTQARSRCLGGTTSQWVGRCVPFDPIDFEHRDYVAHSGWPIPFAEIARYYPRANAWCHAGACTYTREDALPRAAVAPVEGFGAGDFSADRLERWSLPTRFGRDYRQALRTARQVRVLLHSFCVRIDTGREGQGVEQVTVATAPGRHLRIEARRFVLAGGGLESTRLLLAADRAQPGCAGDPHGPLGRYYMGHLFGSVAEIAFNGNPRRTVYGFERDGEGVYCRRRFWLSAAAQRRENVLNTALWLDNPAPADPGHRNGVLSAAYLAMSLPLLGERLAPPAIRTAFRGVPVPRGWPAHLRNIVADLPATGVFLPGFLWRHYLRRRRLPGLMLYNRANRYNLFFHAEQAPSADSRVQLSERCDRFGVPELRVDFRYSEQDIDSVYRVHRLFAEQVARQGCARVGFSQQDVHAHIRRQASDGYHQLGTTRMSADPRHGVVDADCRVHTLHNLYVCSSSVFPTSGQANPTLTIVALAIRLAEHLAAA